VDRELKVTVKSDAFLLVTAAVWGTAFVAQRAGMEHIGPFTFNAVRFALGACSLMPLLLLQRRSSRFGDSRRETASAAIGPLAAAGLLAGTLLFLGSSFQQVGIVYTTAGNAGFITGLYVIIVPLLGLFRRHRPGPGVWAGALLAAAGLYFINDAPGLLLGRGDALVLVCAFFFAVHVLVIGRISPGLPSLPLSIIQFFTCSVLSGVTALAAEEISAEEIAAAAVPILYGGVGSVGVAYTLQVVAQKHAPPAHAAIILSLESVFAMLGGWLLLQEAVPAVKLFGASLMLAGMLAAQLQRYVLFRRTKGVKRISS
jgi:drug/metabolite transporter (DMT)-like permease